MTRLIGGDLVNYRHELWIYNRLIVIIILVVVLIGHITDRLLLWILWKSSLFPECLFPPPPLQSCVLFGVTCYLIFLIVCTHDNIGDKSLRMYVVFYSVISQWTNGTLQYSLNLFITILYCTWDRVLLFLKLSMHIFACFRKRCMCRCARGSNCHQFNN